MFKQPKQILLTSLIGFLLVTTTAAQASETEKTDNQGFQWSGAINLIGGIGDSTSFSIPENDQDRTFDSFINLNLELHLEWNGFFYEQPGLSQQRIDGQFSNRAIGYRFYTSDHWDMEALVMQATNELESEFASPDANLAIVRPTDIRVGIRANGFYDNYFVQAIWTPISLKDDIGGHQVSLSVRRDWQIKNLNLYASLGALYLSDEITNFYYGVSPSLSQDIINVLQIPPEDTRTTAFFSPFDANGGTVFSTQVGFEYPLSEHWVAGGVFSLQRLPNAIDDSPIGTFRQYNSVTALSLTYVF